MPDIGGQIPITVSDVAKVFPFYRDSTATSWV
jgi:hypothetical protein